MHTKHGRSDEARMLHALLATAEDMRKAGQLTEAELAQVKRLDDASRKSDEAGGATVPEALALMQHPVFAMLARRLERKVPTDAGFGRFPDRDG